MTGYKLGKNSHINCPDLVIGPNTIIGDNVTIDVLFRLIIGRDSYIGSGTVIQGRHIEIKRNFYAVGDVKIGGGSCYESRSKLIAGYWCHLGLRSFVNTAENVNIGNEVGIGGESKLYTHGAYLDVLKGFPTQWGPITIGSQVWMPLVTIHPGVTVGDNVVIGSHSLVTKDVPSGSLAMGIPCRVVKRDAFPRKIQDWKAMIIEILRYNDYDLSEFTFDETGFVFRGTRFDLELRNVTGTADKKTENLRNRLRRRGIRFRTEVRGGKYRDWESEF